MKHKKSVLAALMLMLLSAAPVLASDISDAQFVADILVKNLSGTTATEEVAVFDLETQTLIDHYYILEDASNTAIRSADGDDLAYMPAPAAGTKWCVWVPAVAGSAQLNNQLYTGGTEDMAGAIRYFPDTGGMTAVDDDSLELGDDFIFEQQGYIDSSASMNIANEKPSAFYTHYGANLFTPTGHNDPGNDWVNEINAYDKSFSTLASSAIPWSAWGDFLELEFESTDIEAVAFLIDRDSESVSEYDLDAYYSTAWDDIYQGDDASWGNWYYKAHEADGVTKVRIRMRNQETAAHYGYIHEVKLTSQEDGMVSALADALQVNVSGVSSGEHNIKVEADGTNLILTVDEGEAGEISNSVALGGVSVPDNTNDWAFVQNDVAPYLEYQKITVSDVLRQEIRWENDTTFYDLSENGNDCTPTFRTTGTNGNITAEFRNFAPVEEAEFTGTIDTETPDFIGAPPDEPETMYTDGTINLPGAEAINTLLDAGGIPQSLFWFPALFLSIILLIFIVFGLTHSLMGAVITGGAFMAFYSIMGAIPFWTIIIYGVIGGALILKRESIGL